MATRGARIRSARAVEVREGRGGEGLRLCTGIARGAACAGCHPQPEKATHTERPSYARAPAAVRAFQVRRHHEYPRGDVGHHPVHPVRPPAPRPSPRCMRGSTSAAAGEPVGPSASRQPPRSPSSAVSAPARSRLFAKMSSDVPASFSWSRPGCAAPACSPPSASGPSCPPPRSARRSARSSSASRSGWSAARPRSAR